MTRRFGLSQVQGLRLSANCGRRGFASDARELGPGQGHARLANLVEGTVCKILDVAFLNETHSVFDLGEGLFDRIEVG